MLEGLDCVRDDAPGGRGLQTAAFDFLLPDELIAQSPAEPRDQSRLMVVHRGTGRWEHHRFEALPEWLNPGDVLVRNNTRVIPARLLGHREATGGRWEGLYLRDRPEGTWEVLATCRGKPAAGEHVIVGQGLRLQLVARGDDGRWIVRPEASSQGNGAAVNATYSRRPSLREGSSHGRPSLREGSSYALLEQHGQVPLPPYIRKGREGPGDRLRYQTLYARVPGAVAAPTAGLHFTDNLFRRLSARGVASVDCTLHVGLGTFRPIAAECIEDHRLHSEWAELTPVAAAALNQARVLGGRIVAVGTTSARVLETAARAGADAAERDGTLHAFAGETELYLRPGHTFGGLDALVTNFHLPRSSLLVLVAALAGVDLIRAAYAEAIRRRYRFYSYGDAMLIL
jgi:S-adenosylmethionine:tRNA ribosyltransferase-isomerase